jgi:hypothetical protein
MLLQCPRPCQQRLYRIPVVAMVTVAAVVAVVVLVAEACLA